MITTRRLTTQLLKSALPTAMLACLFSLSALAADYRKTPVVAIQVFPSPTRPHFLTKAGVSVGTYVRVGSTNRRADDELIAESLSSSLIRFVKLFRPSPRT